MKLSNAELDELRDRIAAERQRTESQSMFYVCEPQCLTAPKLQQLRAYVDEQGEPAQVVSGRGHGRVEDVRRARVCWLDHQVHDDVYDSIWKAASAANQVFQYEIFPFPDRIQLAVYESAQQGFFNWHMDAAPGDMTRKLSISVPLNEPTEYEGGTLALHHGSTIIEVEQRVGVPIIFPSWLVHQVSPVRSGKRFSLVTWIRGPNWC